VCQRLRFEKSPCSESSSIPTLSGHTPPPKRFSFAVVIVVMSHLISKTNRLVTVIAEKDSDKSNRVYLLFEYFEHDLSKYLIRSKTFADTNFTSRIKVVMFLYFFCALLSELTLCIHYEGADASINQRSSALPLPRSVTSRFKASKFGIIII
jgi:hypothetical protein